MASSADSHEISAQPPKDCLDEAVEEILSSESDAAYSMITAITRIIRLFDLDIEAHVLLFEAYLWGKEVLRQGREIRVPRAWLRGAAFKLAREKSRMLKRLHGFAPSFIDSLSYDYGNSFPEDASLLSSMTSLLEGIEQLKTEKPDVLTLIHLRVVEGQSWEDIKLAYGYAYPGVQVTEESLRQRYTDGRRYLRSLFLSTPVPSGSNTVTVDVESEISSKPRIFEYQESPSLENAGADNDDVTRKLPQLASLFDTYDTEIEERQLEISQLRLKFQEFLVTLGIPKTQQEESFSTATELTSKHSPSSSEVLAELPLIFDTVDAYIEESQSNTSQLRQDLQELFSVLAEEVGAL